MKNLFCSFCVILSCYATAQIERVEPPFWLEGMQEQTVQIMLYGENLAQYEIQISNLEKVEVHRVENPNYLFVNLDLSDQKATTLTINLTKNNRIHTSVNY